ncbi:hypothetical protein FIBSPDRAFT_933606 [Athelia psychrophila]|uniref:Zn(2)-C6 fungal-type domain-containing protein n=1 Tax=Athelia psychrophila TaxID=1759441 RepID=A0A166GT90_9AGAM|nr:hypothetical protein FIBSPDRAFT_933606 [Fibularhizoctonia sp. CBS 109695]
MSTDESQYRAHGDGPEKKRRRVGTVRRPLSCTECKRRKTKCSSLGMTPCASCVQRGKPDECRWESISGTGEAVIQPAEQSFALAAEVETLKQQLHELYDYVHHGTSSSRGQSYPATSPPDHTPAAYRNHDRASPMSGQVALISATDVDRRLESSVSVLESLVDKEERLMHNAAKTLPNNAGIRPTRLPLALDPTTRGEVVLDSVYAILPERVLAMRLTRSYFQGALQLGWHILHESLFMQEEHDFYALEPNTQRSETDPAWIAVYLMVLALAIHEMDPREVEILFPLYNTEEVSRLSTALHQASVLALEVADCDSVPQIRHLQAALLYVPFLLHFGSGDGDRNKGLRHVVEAINTAQWLNLDQLDLSRVPMHDAAFRKCSPRVAFELCKRWFHMLSFLDGVAWKSPGHWKLAEAAARASATQLPRNLNDEDLDDDDAQERPFTEVTHASIPRIGSLLALHTRVFVKDLPHGGLMSYENILKSDATLKAVLDQCPCPLRPIPGKLCNWMQITVYSSINYRFLRLHRPYMARGYVDEEYKLSTKCSIHSAKNIIECQQIMMECPHLRPGFCKQWILGAALVLTVDLVISIDLTLSEHSQSQINCPSISSKRLYVTHALEIFRQVFPEDRTPRVTAQCCKIIEGLLVAVDERMHTHSEGLRPKGDLQDFFDGVSAGLVARRNETNNHNQLFEIAPDMSMLEFFINENQERETQDTQDMLGAWDDMFKDVLGRELNNGPIDTSRMA